MLEGEEGAYCAASVVVVAHRRPPSFLGGVGLFASMEEESFHHRHRHRRHRMRPFHNFHTPYHIDFVDFVVGIRQEWVPAAQKPIQAVVVAAAVVVVVAAAAVVEKQWHIERQLASS